MARLFSVFRSGRRATQCLRKFGRKLGKTTKAREEVPDEVMKKLRFGLMVAFILGLILIGYLGAVYLPVPGRPPRDGQEMIRIPSPDELRTYFMVRTIVSTVNAGLVLYLLIVYVGYT